MGYRQALATLKGDRPALDLPASRCGGTVTRIVSDGPGPERLGIRVLAGSDAFRVKVSGEIDLGVADGMSHAVDEWPLEPHMVVDFAEVTFCDSDGIQSHDPTEEASGWGRPYPSA